jgi:hypothetical protein
MTFAGQLDYTVPAPEVNTGVATPSVASIASALGGVGNDTGSKTYRCIKQYTILGSSLDKVQVGICSMCLEESPVSPLHLDLEGMMSSCEWSFVGLIHMPAQR